MEIDLSKTRISAETRKLDAKDNISFEMDRLTEVETELRSVVIDNNFDTFSALFSLLETARSKGTTLAEAYINYRVNPQSLIKEYNGANCAGLSVQLQSRLHSRGIETFIIPSYGQYLLTKGADEYSQIRTIDLVGLMKGLSEEWVFLAPGLTVDKPIMVSPGYVIQSFGNTYTVTQVNSDSFDILTYKLGKNPLVRPFVLEEVLNPDESLQKNILRTLTRYQVTRQYEDGHVDYMSYDFPQKKFRLYIDGVLMFLDLNNFKAYLDGNSVQLKERFRNPKLAEGFTDFANNIDTIVDELLLPEVRNVLTYIWNSPSTEVIT